MATPATTNDICSGIEKNFHKFKIAMEALGSCMTSPDDHCFVKNAPEVYKRRLLAINAIIKQACTELQQKQTEITKYP